MSSQTKDFGLPEEEASHLNELQWEIYIANLQRFATYLHKQGKDPKKEIGYPENTVKIKIPRFHQLMKRVWEHEEVTTDFTIDHANTLVEALDDDSFRRTDGDRFSEGSKRKFMDAMRNWFEFQNTDWEPDVTFSDGRATDHADPFRRSELSELWQTTLTYKSIPSYNNISPEERDRWKAHLAQELGKPKNEVTPDDWDRVNCDWKIPSLIRTTRGCGWRPDLVGRMEVDWYDPETRTIYIPEGEAPKNESAWKEPLSDESAMALEKWLAQRENIEKYDGRKEIWLTRKGNPYVSGTLNALLSNLIEESDIEPRGRKLVWYSFRHSIGTYVYNEYTDLRIVAEKLRQNSIKSADRYVHPLPELKQEASEMM